VRVGVGMKAHWRKESQYADIAAVWRLAIVSSGILYTARRDVFAKRAQLIDKNIDDGDASVSSQEGSLRALYNGESANTLDVSTSSSTASLSRLRIVT